MKALILYANHHGNHRSFMNEYEVTAVVSSKNDAELYKTKYPSDIVIVDDSHQFLLEHFCEYDCIWSSFPSKEKTSQLINNDALTNQKPSFPNLEVYPEIIFLQYFFSGKWVFEADVPQKHLIIIPQIIIEDKGYWTNLELNGEIEFATEAHVYSLLDFSKNKNKTKTIINHK